MNEKEALATTFIEKAVSEMWLDFDTSHEKLIAAAVTQVRKKLSLTEQEVEMVRQKVKVKLNAIMDDMQQHFSDYRELMTSHLAAILKDELKKVIDLSLNELGFRTDDKKEDLLEPVSKFTKQLQKIQVLSDDFEKFKLEKKVDFKKPEKKVE